MRVFLCGITQNEYTNIEALTEVYEYFDGLIFVDGGSTDGTKELLESRKKEGAIIYRKWTNDHDFQMNEFLRQGPLKLGDWFVLRDSRERFNSSWVKNLKLILNEAANQNIRSIYNYGKGFAFEYFDDMFFHGTPHWGLTGARANAIDFSNYFDENKKEHTWRLRDGEDGDTRDNSYYIDHFFKYYYTYGRSNHLLLGRENNLTAYEDAEKNRQQFRFYCHSKGLSFTKECMIDFLKTKEWQSDQIFLNLFNKEDILKDFYRKNILKQNIKEIQENRNFILS